MQLPCGCPSIEECPHERIVWLWHNDARYRQMWEQREKSPPRKKEIVPIGPGRELRMILWEMKLYEKVGCGCSEFARNMDQWGVEGCKVRRQEIASHLAKEARKRGWKEKLTAAIGAVTSGIFINPLDPYGSLVDLAISRTEEKLHQARTAQTPDTPNLHPNPSKSTSDPGDIR